MTFVPCHLVGNTWKTMSGPTLLFVCIHPSNCGCCNISVFLFNHYCGVPRSTFLRSGSNKKFWRVSPRQIIVTRIASIYTIFYIPMQPLSIQDSTSNCHFPSDSSNITEHMYCCILISYKKPLARVNGRQVWIDDAGTNTHTSHHKWLWLWLGLFRHMFSSRWRNWLFLWQRRKWLPGKGQSWNCENAAMLNWRWLLRDTTSWLAVNEQMEQCAFCL